MSAAEDSLVDGASDIIGAFSAVSGDVIFGAVSPSFNLLGGAKTLPSAL